MIVVTGSAGQLGGELISLAPAGSVPLDRRRCDLTDRLSVWRVLSELRPRVVINAAAYTKVDQAEKEPDLCFAVNAAAVSYLADACRRLDATLVQISSDYVFDAYVDRTVPFQEHDPPRANGVYAKSKIAGEAEAAACPRHFIVRTCGLYRRVVPGGGQSNFPTTMLRSAKERDRLRVVADQRCTPSYVPHVARGVLFLSRTEAYGIYHLTNQGETTWFEFAEELFRLAGINVPVVPITTAEYGAPAPRPVYSVLDTSKYQALGGPPLPHWKQALAEFWEQVSAAG